MYKPSILKPDDNVLYSLEAEQTVLGTILHNNNNIHKVSGDLSPQHFWQPTHKAIYTTMLKLVEKDMIITALHVSDYYISETNNTEYKIDKNDLHKYLFGLQTTANLIYSINNFSRVVIDYYTRRQLLQYGNEVICNALDTSLCNSSAYCIEKAEALLSEIVTHGNVEECDVSYEMLAREVLKKQEDIKTGKIIIGDVYTGFIDLDKIIGGLVGGNLIVLGSRPSMGKTALSLCIAVNIARSLKDKIVYFFSLEMSREEIIKRAFSIGTEMSSLPMWINDKAGLTIGALKSKAIRLNMKHKLGLIVVDYLQLIKTNEDTNVNRVQQIGEITRGLKELAKELNVPVLALCQLSRAVEMREDKKPQLQDLRESGDIEQDADIVMTMWRPEYYLSRAEPSSNNPEKIRMWQENMRKAKNVAEVFVLKNRNGPIGKCDLFFNEKTTLFSNLSRSYL